MYINSIEFSTKICALTKSFAQSIFFLINIFSVGLVHQDVEGVYKNHYGAAEIKSRQADT